MSNVCVDRITGEVIEDLSKFDKKLHRFAFISDKPSKTDTSQKDQCDLNFMIKKFGAVSLINRALESGKMTNRKPIEDLTVLPENYQDVLVKTAQVKEAFASLPASEREKFGHNPLNYMDSLYTAELEASKASDESKVILEDKAVEMPISVSNGEPTASDAPNK